MYSVALGEKKLYILVHAGDVVAWSTNKEDVLFEAYEVAQYYINDFWRHKLPMKLTEDDIHSIDVYVFELDKESLVELPAQEWVDDYYIAQRDEKRAAPIREYKHYLELTEKWAGKAPPEGWEG